MDRTRMLRALAIGGLSLAITACGGGGTGGDGGDTQVLGPITGFGSVFVDGVEFETAAARILINGEPATESELRLGMVVALVTDDGSREVRELVYVEDLVGPIGQVSGQTLKVLGQKIRVTELTVFESDDPQVTEPAALVAGDVVRVSGHRGGHGVLFATRIELEREAIAGFRVRGRIDALDATAERLTINELTVDYSGAELRGANPGRLVPGALVTVIATGGPDDAGLLHATRLELSGSRDHPDDHALEPAKVRAEGRVSAIDDSAGTFELGGQTFLLPDDLDARAAIVLDAPLRIDARADDGGRLTVTRIRTALRGEIEIEGVVAAIDLDAGTLAVDGQRVQVTPFTIMEDDDDERYFNLASLDLGDRVELDAYRDRDGVLTAAKLERKSRGQDGDEDDRDEDDRDDDGHDDDGAGTDGGTGDNGGSGGFKVLAFNDLGMHCADLDYRNFVILPPYNVVHAQVIERGATPRIVGADEVTTHYLGQADAAGSINTTSQNQAGGVRKSNFWEINPNSGNPLVQDLFGLNPPPDEGLAFGQAMPGILDPYVANDPQPFNHYDPAKQWFAADGIPILPIDDAGRSNPYPLMRVQARDRASGDTLAELDVVLPVASEADCQNCHALGEVGASSERHPQIPFVFPDEITDPNAVLQAAKENILLLHDAKHGTELMAQRPVLCASCHYSAALDLAGAGPGAAQQGRGTMSAVMHGHHGELTDPNSGAVLFPDGAPMEQTCYQCHPGKVTKCLRGAMGGSGIDCESCHGGMQAVGGRYPLAEGGSLDGSNDGNPRRPWLDVPRCQSCHTGDALDHQGGSLRLSRAYVEGDPSASPRLASNKRFAENDGQLYRNSVGHGGVACEGCHGSTHAIWPNAAPNANDNVAAVQLQGHAGTLIDCATCHTRLPLTLGGPHGMHNVNDPRWTDGHEAFYERDPQSCRSCHGSNLEGTPLARTAADRTLEGDDHRQIVLAKGTEVSCTLCHEHPDRDD